MSLENDHISDVEEILSHRYDNGGDYWATPDGRFKFFPAGGIYPCQTAEAARTLCHMGYANDSRIETTFQYL